MPGERVQQGGGQPAERPDPAAVRVRPGPAVQVERALQGLNWVFYRAFIRV